MELKHYGVKGMQWGHRKTPTVGKSIVNFLSKDSYSGPKKFAKATKTALTSNKSVGNKFRAVGKAYGTYQRERADAAADIGRSIKESASILSSKVKSNIRSASISAMKSASKTKLATAMEKLRKIGSGGV